MLYIVATPIGHLEDITFRAVEVLKSVDLIACEDTRHTRILLQRYGIQTATTSFFQHSRLSKVEFLLDHLKQGKSLALVSDAGTPGILDPGAAIIRLAIENNIPLTFIPGPTALIHALVLSGKPAHEFVFAGFLPKKSQARLNRLKKLSDLGCTLVFYESCHRLVPCLQDVHKVFGQRPIACCRELTKKFEEVLRGSAQEILAGLKDKRVRGEFVIVV